MTRHSICCLRLKVIDGVDTVYSNQVALKVSTIPVNADKPEEFNDIKTVWKPPFVWADYYPIIYGILLALFLICVIAYIVKRIRAKKSLIPFKKEERNFRLTSRPSRNWMRSSNRNSGSKDEARSITP